MSPSQTLVADLSAALLALTIAGLVARRRWRLWRSFFGYLVACFVCNRLITWWPEQFYRGSFWSVKETLYSLLKVFMAAELLALTFQSFPRAKARACTLFGSAVAVTLYAVSLKPAEDSYWVILGFVQSRGQAGAIWLFLVVVAAAAWYRVPLHPLHRAIVAGFVPYLAVYSVLAPYVSSSASPAYQYLAALDPAAYAGTVGVWAFAAWRSGPARVYTPELLHRLQPWAVQ